MKKCSKCGEVKPIDMFYEDKSRKDSLSNRCKSCISEYSKKRYLKNIDEFRAIANSKYVKKPKVSSLYKVCSRCGIDKRRDEFYYNKSKKCLHASCILCTSEFVKQNRVAEKQKILSKTWRVENKNKCVEYEKNRRGKSCRKEYEVRYREQRSEKMPDSYIANRLEMKISECPTELIEAKREQIIIKRLSHQLKQSLKPTKENHETSSNTR